MKQFKIFTDFKKEEKYLNEKSKNGFFLKKYTSYGVYHFEKGTPKDIKYKIDYRTFKKKSDFSEYLTLFEDAGWIHVYGTRYSLNQYFISKDNNSDAEIFSTKESAAARHKTCYEMCILSAISTLIYFISIFAINDFNISNLWFLTPDIWSKKGMEFITAFLFELPFVFIRIGVPVFFLVIAIIYAVWASQAKKCYNELIK